MKQTILLITLLVSTLGMANEFKGPYETMSGVSQEELDMIESVSRDQEKGKILSFNFKEILLKLNKSSLFDDREYISKMPSKSIFNRKLMEESERLNEIYMKSDNRELLLPARKNQQK